MSITANVTTDVQERFIMYNGGIEGGLFNRSLVVYNGGIEGG